MRSIFLYTDASTRQNYSCWVYKVGSSNDITYDIVCTTNIAAMETLAIIKGIESLAEGSKIVVISDFKAAVTLINTYRKFKQVNFYNSNNLYAIVTNKLKELLPKYDISGIWVRSKCCNPCHLEVDQISKIRLKEFLNK